MLTLNQKPGLRWPTQKRAFRVSLVDKHEASVLVCLRVCVCVCVWLSFIWLVSVNQDGMAYDNTRDGFCWDDSKLFSIEPARVST